MPFDSTVPRTKLELAFWANERAGLYALDGTSFGLTDSQGTAFNDDAMAYQAALDVQRAAKTTYGTSTELVDAAYAKLIGTANGSVKSINGYAQTVADPAAVYSQAKLSPRKPGRPQQAPDAPVAVKATLDANGDVVVEWGGSKASRAFRVQRQLLDAAGQASGWVDLPSDGEARFIDPSVAVGTTQASYRVKALRGGKASGWSEPGNLRFVGTAATTPSTLKIAA